MAGRGRRAGGVVELFKGSAFWAGGHGSVRTVRFEVFSPEISCKHQGKAAGLSLGELFPDSRLISINLIK